MGGSESYVVNHEVVPSSLFSIVPFLAVASEIENERPRVAYLCRFYTYKKVHKLDPSARGHGVGRFKNSLLERLEQDNLSSLDRRVFETDAQEIKSCYSHYYTQYIRALDQGEHADREQLGKAYKTAGVLFYIMRAVNNDGNNNNNRSTT